MSSSVQSFCYQIFEVAFFFFFWKIFPTVFPCDRSEFFSRKGNCCALIAQKPQVLPKVHLLPQLIQGRHQPRQAQQWHSSSWTCSWPTFPPGWEKMAPRGLMSPPERCDLPAALASGEEPEPGAGGIHGCVGPWMGLFLSLGLHSARRESRVWHFCTGKLAEWLLWDNLWSSHS